MDITFQPIFCPACHVLFGLTNQHLNHLKSTHESFYCPHGHRSFFPEETEEERLRKITLEQGRRISELRTQLDICESTKPARKARTPAAPKNKKKRPNVKKS